MNLSTNLNGLADDEETKSESFNNLSPSQTNLTPPQSSSSEQQAVNEEDPQPQPSHDDDEVKFEPNFAAFGDDVNANNEPDDTSSNWANFGDPPPSADWSATTDLNQNNPFSLTSEKSNSLANRSNLPSNETPLEASNNNKSQIVEEQKSTIENTVENERASNNEAEEKKVPSIAYDQLEPIIEKIFARESTHHFIDESSSSSNIELIDSNDVWLQLKEYTTETDASVSLKFKWKLSELETNFLDALSLTRALNQSNSKTKSKNNPPYFFSSAGGILQPTKVDQQLSENSKASSENESSVKFDAPMPVVESTNVADIKANQSNTSQSSSSSSLGVIKFDPPMPVADSSTSSSLLANQINFDLSYFESGSNEATNKPNETSTSDFIVKSANTHSSSSLNGAVDVDLFSTIDLKQLKTNNSTNNKKSLYLNELLQEAYHKPSQQQQQQQQQIDTNKLS